MFHIFWENFHNFCKYYSYFWRLFCLAICNRPYSIHDFSNSQNHTVQWFYKGNSHREETPGNQVKPKLALLPISSLNGQMPFTAFERAILPASFIPNCFIWKHRGTSLSCWHAWVWFFLPVKTLGLSGVCLSCQLSLEYPRKKWPWLPNRMMSQNLEQAPFGKAN